MKLLHEAVLVLVSILGAECSIRYAGWWLKMIHEKNLLREVLLGIVFTKAGFGGFAALAIVAAVSPLFVVPIWLRIAFDLLIATGIILNLASYWKVTYAYSARDVAVAALVRVAVAAIIVAVLVVFCSGGSTR
jgi:hypothetical protein